MKNESISSLTEIVKTLRGQHNYVGFAKRTGVNRQTLTDLEKGIAVKFDTLKRIANACNVREPLWTKMMIAWIRATLGEGEFSKLDIRPATNPTVVKAARDTERMLLTLYRRLLNKEKADVLKAMMRVEVRACLAASNQMWDQLKNESDLNDVINHEVPEVFEEAAKQIAGLKDEGKK